MEYASPEEGYLLKVLANPGDGVALDAPICVLGEKGEDFDLEALKTESGAASSKAPAAEETKSEPAAPAAAAHAPAATLAP